MKSCFKNWQYWLAAVIFFVIGFSVSELHSKYTQKTLADFHQDESIKKDSTLLTDSSVDSQWVEVSPTPSPITNWQETTPSKPSGKFIIQETQKITASQSKVETGEQVDFSVTLKNVGNKKKFLTHICFQYSGGNFGCILNKNLFPGEEFGFSNSMMFPNPGTYQVWIVWSQDKTNFYRPINGGSAPIIVN